MEGFLYRKFSISWKGARFQGPNSGFLLAGTWSVPLSAKIFETLGISPGQLNPPAWRTLIALQNLGDLNGLVIGVTEVMYSYSVSPLGGAEWRYHLRPRRKEPPVISLKLP
ncbi:hypothetical protein DY000_02031497 [Brassica cretica]|uniref:Uncharacterized protein n=1 Tax=Brassica cretica TaxID=69181 RepID=A0ABQ7DIK2_BRACR|nr:hypothetical protein DY000_02031497 [Brassica cretica]